MPLLGHCKDVKTNSDLGAVSAFKLRAQVWMVLHSGWTLVLQGKKIIYSLLNDVVPISLALLNGKMFLNVGHLVVMNEQSERERVRVRRRVFKRR